MVEPRQNLARGACGVLLLLPVVAMIVAAPAAVNAQNKDSYRYRLEIPTCTTVPAAAIIAQTEIELAPVIAVAPSADHPYLIVITLDCRPDSVLIRATPPRAESVTRELDLADVEPVARARLTSLAIVELAVTARERDLSWTPPEGADGSGEKGGGGSDDGDGDGGPAAISADETGTDRDGGADSGDEGDEGDVEDRGDGPAEEGLALVLDARAVGHRFFGDTPWMAGGGIGVAMAAFAPVWLVSDVSAVTSEASLDVGSARVFAVSASVGVSWPIAITAWLDVSPAVLMRGGYVSFSPREQASAVVESESVAGGWGGGAASVALGAQFDPVAVAVAAEGGFAAFGTVALVDERREFEAGGPWLGVVLSVGWLSPSAASL